MKRGEECTVAGCVKPIQCRDLCPMHYQRQRIHGSTEYVKPPESPTEMASRFWGKVNKTATCWLWQAGKRGPGYGIFTWKRRDYVAHRFSYELLVGEIPEGMVIDHICHTPACVNPTHLRLATSKQNAENRRGANRNGKSGIRGVSYIKRDGKWKGQAGHNYTRYAKYFDTPEEAAAYAQTKRQELFTHTIEKRSSCKPQS